MMRAFSMPAQKCDDLVKMTSNSIKTFPTCYDLVKTRSNNIKTLPKCDDLMKIKTETSMWDF